MTVLWLDDVTANDFDSVGGKAASLGELTAAGLPVPPGFVVSAETYRSFLDETGIAGELFEVVDVDSSDSEALARAAERAQELVCDTEMPESVRSSILAAYDDLDDGAASVAVRSSATAEDLPSIAADESALIKVDGEPVFGRMGEITPVDCERHTVEVPSLTDRGVAWREVEELYEHPAEDARLYRITTATGRQITVSPDHSLVVLDEDTLEPRTTTVGELDDDEKVPVVRDLAPIGTGSDTIDVTEYLQGGDVLRSDGGVSIDNDSTNETSQHSLPRTIQADDDFAYFLGLYVAEGSTYGVSAVSVTNTEEEVLDRVIDVMDRLGLWNGQAENKHSYRFHCKSLVRFLHAVAGEPAETTGKGRLAGNKRVPEFVFGWDRTRIGHFLRGCFDGDGTVHDEIGYATTSERLVEGIVRLLELLGIDYRIREREGDEDWNDSFRVLIPAREAEEFRANVGFESTEKSERLDELVETHRSKEYYPEFTRTITVSETLSEHIRDRFEEPLPEREITVAHCPDCGDEINKSSPYDGRDRWYCSDCGAAFYEDDVAFETEERYSPRDSEGRFEDNHYPWNKAQISGTYSQNKFNRLVDDLGVTSLEFDETVAWEDIERVEAVEYDGPVYDFCVPGAENFAAGRGSVVTHNTASFAGQQETFLNVDRSRLLDAVRDCWASLFTQRAIYYRNEQDFDHDAVNIAVVVQRMVDAERSGVMFTSHPTTGDSRVIAEAAWGLGEAVVSGAVSPDRYVVDRDTGETLDVEVSTKKVMHVRDEETGETIERQVPEERRDERVLSEADLERLVDLGETVQSHYGEPQDVEWAIGEGDEDDDADLRGDLVLLQSRPITTIDEEDATDREEPTAKAPGGDAPVGDTGADTAGTGANGGASAGTTGTTGTADGGTRVAESESDAPGDVALTGFGASPGKVAGTVRIVRTLDHLDRVEEGDLIVAEMTTPDMVPAMERAAGIITDEGGMTSHASIVSRELGVPAVVGTEDATEALSDGEVVTIDGDKGTVSRGGETPSDSGEETKAETEPKPAAAAQVGTSDRSGGSGQPKPMTATDVKVNLSVPDAAERAAATGADGVGLLRTEHMVLSTGKTPERYIEAESADAFVSELVDGIRKVAEAFYPRPVRVRTLDAPTDEFRELEGGEDEPHEHNPMLGWRGVRRSLDQPDVFTTELAVFRRLYDMGYDNVEVMFPLVNDAEDVLRARECLVEAGIDPDKRPWGVMIETPAAALSIEGIVDTGVEFVSFGTNDLTQYTLAVDRNNERLADRFDELHPAVLDLIESTIETCREHDVSTSICGQAASKPEMVEALVQAGITSVSPNVDAVRDVQREAKRVEQRLLLDSVR